MKIAGQNVENPLAESALEKLKKSGRQVLGDDDVGTADEANRLLNVVKDGIVNEGDFQALNASLQADQKLTREEFTALAGEFQIRFPAAKRVPAFVGLSRYFGTSPLKGSRPPTSLEERIREIDAQIEKASVGDLAKGVLFLNRSPVMADYRKVPSWALEINEIRNRNDGVRLAAKAAHTLMSAVLRKLPETDAPWVEQNVELNEIKSSIRSILMTAEDSIKIPKHSEFATDLLKAVGAPYSE